MASRWSSAISRLYLAYISPISPVYLGEQVELPLVHAEVHLLEVRVRVRVRVSGSGSGSGLVLG